MGAINGILMGVYAVVVIRKFLTDQCIYDLECDIVPQTKLHMFNLILPQLIRGLPIAVI